MCRHGCICKAAARGLQNTEARQRQGRKEGRRAGSPVEIVLLRMVHRLELALSRLDVHGVGGHGGTAEGGVMVTSLGQRSGADQRAADNVGGRKEGREKEGRPSCCTRSAGREGGRRERNKRNKERKKTRKFPHRKRVVWRRQLGGIRSSRDSFFFFLTQRSAAPKPGRTAGQTLQRLWTLTLKLRRRRPRVRVFPHAPFQIG